MKMCQCPQRASTYFFEYKFMNDDIVDRAVSMPSTGFYLFLHSFEREANRYLMCQCPQRASTYFFNF